MHNFLSSIHPSVWLGVFLIIINFPLGWAGLFWFIHHARITKKKIFYIIGGIFYISSWAALVLGVFLVGKEYAGEFFIKYHAYIIVFSIIGIITLISFKHYYSKKDLKINKK